MKLHLPIALLAAVLSAVAYGAEGTYTYKSTDGTDAPFTQNVEAKFWGDWTGKKYGPSAATGYSADSNGVVGGLYPSTSTSTANNISVTVGNSGEKTLVNKVIGVGYVGYASTGNKEINIVGSSETTSQDFTYVGLVVGGQDLQKNATGGYSAGTFEKTSVGGNADHFAKKSDTDKNITISVDGGIVGQIRGGNSGHSTRVDGAIGSAWKHYTSVHANIDYATDAERQAAIRKDVEAFVANAPWHRNEEINITVSGDSKVGYNVDGVTAYESVAEAAIYGAGGTSHSINNDVNITIKDNAKVLGNVLGGAVSNTYTKDSTDSNKAIPSTDVNSSVNNTHITISDNSTVDGNVYGGGWSKTATSTAIVKGNTEIVLEGGTVTGNVYGAGHGDLVEGNTKVVIKGNGTAVGGTIYGGGETAVFGGVTKDSVVNVNSNRTIRFEGYHEVEPGSYKTEGFNVYDFADSDVTLGDLTGVKEIQVDNVSDVKINSINGGQAVYLKTREGFYTPGATPAAKLHVNGDLVLAEGSFFNGHEKSPYSTNDNAVSGALSAASISTEGAVSFSTTTVTATTGNISIGGDSTLTNTDLTANNGTVKLTDSTMNGGAIVAKSFFNDSSNTVVDSVTVTTNGVKTPYDYAQSASLGNTGHLTINGDLQVGNGNNIWHEGDGALRIQGDVNGRVSFHVQNGGIVEYGGNLNASYFSVMNGTLEFSGIEGTAAGNVNGGGMSQLEDGSNLVHSGDGNVILNQVYTSGDVKIHQTGNGTLAITDFGAGTLGTTTTAIEQSSFGKIVLNGMVAESGASTLNLFQTGGGTIENRGSLDANKIVLKDSSVFENNGTASFDKIVASNSAIPVGEPDADGIYHSVDVTKSNTVVSNTGEMVIGDIWNTATANNKNSQGYSKLTLENSGADATMTVTGTMLNLGGETNLKNTDGAIFVNQGSADFNKVTLQDSGKYVNTGSSEIGKIVAGNTAIIQESAPTEITKSNTVVSNTGEMVIGDIWNTATANNENSQGYSKLTLENSGADATMTVTGTMLNLGGETNLKNTDGAIFVNQGSADFNKITSDDSSITNNGTLKADTVKITGDTTIENNGKAIIGEVYKMDGDTTLVNNKDMEIKNILNSAPMGQESSLNIENNADANLKITGGIIDPVNGVNLHQKGGTVELANKTSVSFNLVGEGNTGKLVHSGEGTATISGGAGANDWAVLDSSYVVEQTGTGTLKLDGNFRSTENKKLDVAIKQTGAGNIELDATFYASSSAGSTFAVEQSGGGKVTVEENGLFTKVDVSNLSTFENMASINVVEVAVNGATLSTSGALHFGVVGTLDLTDATLAVNTNSFTSSNAAILMNVGSQITSLDCDAYNIVFGQDTEGLDAMLAGEKLGQTFSVSLITGFDADGALLAEDLCAAFDKDMLTLQAVDAKGQLIDLLVHDAELSFNGGAIVLSGTASVPEPTTATLSLLALAALAARRRRK